MNPSFYPRHAYGHKSLGHKNTSLSPPCGHAYPSPSTNRPGGSRGRSSLLAQPSHGQRAAQSGRRDQRLGVCARTSGWLAHHAPHPVCASPCDTQSGPVLHAAPPRGKKRLRNANINERSRGRCLLPGHGTFCTSKVGAWRLAVVGGGRGWRLVVGGGWRLAVGGPWGRSSRAGLSKKKNNLRLLKAPCAPLTMMRTHGGAHWVELLWRELSNRWNGGRGAGRCFSCGCLRCTALLFSGSGCGVPLLPPTSVSQEACELATGGLWRAGGP